MNKKADYFSLIKTRLFLLLIIFSFAGPLVLASLMYKYSDIVPIPSPKSHGNLIEPVITINSNEDFYETLMNEKKWVFMYVYEDETCDLVCEATLYMMQQVRESVGRERQRISNVAIVKKSFLNNENKKVINKYNKIKLLKIIDNSFFNKLKKNHLYLVDPLGNIFMYYQKDFNPKGLKKDIKKILKVSRIG
jgi:cytochrome oxidase Cu insertion factor (SCO1/SenC/PrrC family)|tara:strand:- start:19551 stop:20126 length:576 start_codon:yes stop_codon:yes gene_type:complete